MSALKIQEFQNFWFLTGTPTFLVQELEKEYRAPELKMFDLKDFETTADDLGIAEIGETPLVALMFQTGYLTITGFDKERKLYLLGYPNHEVRTATQKRLLSLYSQMKITETNKFSSELSYALRTKNIAEIVSLIKSVLIRVPYPLHIKQEKFYHGLLQVLFGAAGVKAYSEHMTSHARIDMVIEMAKFSYVIECKFNESAEKALEQIKDRKYYEALQHHNKSVILLGLAFHRKKNEFDITYISKEIPN